MSRIAVLSLLFSTYLRADNVTWTNGSADFSWNTTSANWSSGAWVNSNSDAAIFGATGVGTINVASQITVRSLNFQVDGYTLNGTSPLSFSSAGTGTLVYGGIAVASGATATINAPITSTERIFKSGAGTLVLGGTNSFTGTTPITGTGNLTVNVMIGDSITGATNAGTLRLTSATAMPATTSVGIGNGVLDIGSNNITLANLRFTNQTGTVGVAWNNSLNISSVGVIGSGTLRVVGEITVNGVGGSNSTSNAIGVNLDLGGGTQIIRVGRGSSIALNNSLVLSGVVSNGSIVKTIGPTSNGSLGGIDGMTLSNNNTYTGATILNSGTNVFTGTNASTLVKIIGINALSGSNVTMQGANGSFLAATTLQAYAGGTIILDNNAAMGANGNNVPNVPAAQNNNRIRDDAAIELRDGSFTYRGLTTVAATESFGSLNASGGHNIVTLTPNGTGGTVTLTAAGNFSLGDRATAQIASTTLGAASKLIVNGTIPAADTTGIITRMIGSSDFLTYNGVTGFTAYTGYATDFSMTGTNVALTAAATAPTVAINALKTTGTLTTTIGTGNTLTINSGMIFSTSGTHTVSGGTLAFGSVPGVLFGSNTINSSVTGTNGLIVANGTNTVSGDWSGLTGQLTVNATGTTTMNASNFAGSIVVRMGTLNLGANALTGGAITLGVPQNDVDLFTSTPSLSISGAGANAVIARNIIVDNGSTNAAGITLINSYIPQISPLSNVTGSQTISGNITLNTSLNLQGGGGGGAGATNFSGFVSGNGTFYIPNGRFVFQAGSTLSNAGGLVLGGLGFTTIGTFAGTASGSGPITMSGGNNTVYNYAAGSLPTGQITFVNGNGTTSPTIVPTNSSTLTNNIAVNGEIFVNVPSGVTATWSGVMTGTSLMTQQTGTGTLVLSNASNAYTGNVVVNAGTMRIDGVLAGSTLIPTVTINSGGTLAGSGVIGATGATRAVTVAANGALAPGGTSIGNLTITGNTTITAASANGASLNIRAARSAANTLSVNDRLIYAGNLNFNGLAAGTPGPGDNKFRIQIINDVTNPLIHGEMYTMTIASGTGQIQRNGTQINTSTYIFNANDYSLYSPTFTAFENVNIQVNTDGTMVLSFSPVPEPTTLFAVAGVFLIGTYRSFKRKKSPCGVYSP